MKRHRGWFFRQAAFIIPSAIEPGLTGVHGSEGVSLETGWPLPILLENTIECTVLCESSEQLNSNRVFADKKGPKGDSFGSVRSTRPHIFEILPIFRIEEDS